MSRHGFTSIDRSIRTLVSLGLIFSLIGDPGPLPFALAAADPVLQPGTETPTVIPTATSTHTETVTASPADRATPTAMERATIELKQTETPVTPSPEPTASEPPSATEPTATPSETATATVSPTASGTPSPTASGTATATETPTFVSTIVPLIEPTVTATVTATEVTKSVDIESLIPEDMRASEAASRASAKDGNPEEVASVSAKEGGAILFDNRHVLVVAERGALPQDVEIVLRQELVEVAKPTEEVKLAEEFAKGEPVDWGTLDATLADHVAVRYRIEAIDPVSGAAVNRFEKPIRLYFDLRGLRSVDAPANWVIAYQNEKDPEVWHRVAVDVVDANGLIGTETDHLSVWSLGDEPGQWHYNWAVPAVAEFSGSAQYTFPIAEPPGRGGLQPNVDLSYSSGALNGQTRTSADQGLFGLGWSIADTVEISRKGIEPRVDGGLYVHYYDTFQISINGQGADLVPETEAINPTPGALRRVVSRVAKVTGSGSAWASRLTRNFSAGLFSGQSATFRIKFPDVTDSALVSMIPTDYSDNRFGLYLHDGTIHFQTITNSVKTESPTVFTPYANLWYVVTLRVDDSGGMKAEIYNEARPTDGWSWSVALPTGKAWAFRAWANLSGDSFYLDDYNESAGAGWHDNFDTASTANWTYTGLGSQQIVPFEDLDTGRFYADNIPGLFIVRVYSRGNESTVLNTDKIFWVVKTPDGKTYRLGYPELAVVSQYGFATFEDDTSGHGASGDVGLRWLVDHVWDTHNNVIEYAYRDGGDDFSDYGYGVGNLVTRTRRLSEIRYNFDDPANFATPRTVIQFVNAGGVWGQRRSNQIKIFHTDLATPIRVIDLGLQNLTTGCGQCLSIDYIGSIQERTNSGTVLPATTLSYENVSHENVGWLFPHLQAITNGYGGRVEFTFSNDGRFEEGNRHRFGKSFFVTQMRTTADYFPGNSLFPTPHWTTTTYQYETPCYDQTGTDQPNWYLGSLPNPRSCPTRRYITDWPPQGYGFGPLIGFQTVTVKQYDFDGQQVSKTVSTFNLSWTLYAGSPNEWAIIGKPVTVQRYDARDLVVEQTTSSYSLQTFGGANDHQGQAHFAYLSSQTTLVTGGSMKTTDHYFQTQYQGSQQFGNPTGTTESQNGTPYRDHHQEYYPNTARWIVGLPGLQVTSEFSSSSWTWQYKGATCLSYDWHAACTSAIDGKGELVATRRVQNLNETTGIPANPQFEDHRYWYDAYGQVTQDGMYPYYGTNTWYAYNEATGNVITTTYDSTYHIYPVTVVNQKGQSTGLSWHWSQSVPSVITNPNGASTYFYIDGFGRVWRVLRPLEATFTVDYVYGDSGLTTLSGPLSLQTKQAMNTGVVTDTTLNTYVFYDGFGRQIQARTPMDGGGTSQSVVNVVYDALGRTLSSYVPFTETASSSLTLPSGWNTRSHSVTSYDWLGRPLEQASSNGATSSFSYVGQTTIAVDANGHRDQSVTDVFGRTTSVVESTSEPTVIEVEGTSAWHQIGSAQGGAWMSPNTAGGSVGYLTNGPYQPPQQTGPGQVVRFRIAIDVAAAFNDAVAELDVSDYSDYGTILAKRTIYRNEFQGLQDSQGGLSNYRDFSLVFDSTGRAGHQLEYRIKWLATAKMAHDKTLVIWSGGNPTTYGYSALDQLTSVTQGASTITVHYNALGQKDDMVDPDMGRWVYGYNELGQLVTQTDNRGCVTTLTYDKLSRIRTKAYTGPGTCGTTPGVTYTYDVGTNNVGHRTRMDDGSGWTQWAYDTRGRLQSETRYVNLLNQSFVTQYEYNPMDQVKRILMPNGEWVAYTYEQGTLNAVTSQETGYGTYLTSMSYDVAGRLTGMTYGNNVSTTLSYFSWFVQAQGGRLQSQTAGSGNGIQNFGYTYDYVGNIKTLTDGTNSGQVQTFGYDAQDRLTTAGANGVGIDPNYSQAFTYLANGNLQTANTSYLGGVTQTYSYSASAASCQQAPTLTHAVSAVGTVATYSYDCNGNMVSRTETRNGVSQTFVQDWDAENRLKSVSTGGQTTTFIYDGDGARVLQQRPDGYTSVYVNRFLEIAVNQPTATSTPTSTSTATATRTQTPVASTPTVTQTPTRTQTPVGSTPTSTRTATRTATPTPTPTRTATATATAASACPANSLVTNGCFETGNLTGWETYSGSPSVTTGAKYSGTYGANYPNGSALRQVFTTVAGQSYTVSARLRIDSQSGSDWGGFRVQITDYNWSDLGQSVYYTTANSPLGTWTLVTLTFTAVSTQSRIEVSQFSGPSLSMIGDWDEIAVVASSGAVPHDPSALGLLGAGAMRAAFPPLAVKGLHRPASDAVTQRLAAERKLEAVRAWAAAWGRWLSVSGVEPTLTVRHKALSRPTALLSPGAGQTYRISYFAGSRLVAVREVGVKNSLNFMHLDHLGSPSAATIGTTEQLGQLVAGSTTRYYPFGMPRPGFSGGQSFTDAAFTGQISDAYTGLMYYNARYYDPYLNRFVSADSVVPGAGNPQNLNKYSYVNNRPEVQLDPGGHEPCTSGTYVSFCPPSSTPSPLSNFDPATGPTNLPISDWYGENANNDLATQRASQVIHWLRNYTGPKWWEGDFPSVMELTAWLLYEEGSLLNNDELVFMARIIRYRLRNGITAEVLAGFTAFFNPNGGLTFNKNDWREIAEAIQNAKKVDLTRYFQAAEAAYAMSENAYVPRDDKGNLVLWWWLEHEAARNGGTSHGYIETNVTVAFDNGRPVFEKFYFGNEQQCREAKYGGCQ